MLDAIIAGERSPRVLAEMARGSMRRKTAALEEALDCSFLTGEHVFVLSMMLGEIDHCTARIAVPASGSPRFASPMSGRSPSWTASRASACGTRRT